MEQPVHHMVPSKTMLKPQRLTLWVYAAGAFAFAAMSLSGVGSDLVQIPTLKKILLAAANVLVIGLLGTRSGHPDSVWAILLGAILFLFTAVMWFWN